MCSRVLQLDNMLLHNAGQSEMLKLCDFGYSKDDGLGTEASGCKTACGTPEYMAPEVRREPSPHRQALVLHGCVAIAASHPLLLHGPGLCCCGDAVLASSCTKTASERDALACGLMR